MMRYVALIRGIGPGDPKKSNQSLRGALESLGLQNVRSVISSGNVIFDSPEADNIKVEAMIEAAWPRLLGFEAATIVQSQAQLQAILNTNHFDGLVHSETSYLLVTFLKRPTNPAFSLPYQPPGKPYKILAIDGSQVYSVTNNTILKTTDLMTWLEKQFSKDITSRTPLTIGRILKRMAE